MKSKLEFLCAMLIFGTIGLFRRIIPFPSSLIAASRGLIGTLFLLLFMKFQHQKLSISKIKKHILPLILSGTLMGFNWILLFESYNYTSVAVSTVCYYMAPIFVILVSPLIFDDKLSMRKIGCAVVSFAGILLVSGILNVSFHINEIKGVLFGIAAAVLYATVILINKKLTDIDAFDRTVLQLGSSAIVLFPYTMMTENLSSLTLNGHIVILLLITGIVHTGIAYALYFHSIKDINTETIALYSYVDPISAILFSALFLQESMSVSEVIGMILILGAALFSEIQKKP